MLEEAVGTLRWLWGDAPAAPASRHFSVSAEPLNPGPVQRPRLSESFRSYGTCK